jgi:single-stranded-DNA-specific exonuclease
MARLGTIDFERIMKRTRLSPLAAQVLKNRFPDESDPVNLWLPSRPDWSTLLPDLDILKDELFAVKKRGGKIILYGHDDMDGVTGIFIGLRILRSEGFHVVPIVPRRDIETYGIRPGRLKGILNPGDLLLTVDYGCSAVEGIAWARGLGARIVVTDHHTLNPPLPEAHGMVNPQITGGDAADLAGCGILYAALSHIFPKWENDAQLLAAVALGTVSDRVPFTEWNRYLLHCFAFIDVAKLTEGLKLLMQKWPCRKKAWTGAMVRQQITSTVGKGDNSGIASMIDFMFSYDAAWCRTVWNNMQEGSEERGRMLSDVVSLAIKKKDSESDALGMILVFLEDIPDGMGGTVASRLCKSYRRGTIVVTRREDGKLIGDTRSVGDWNMAGFLVSMRHIFSSAGGHYRAAGFSYEGTDWEELRNHLITHMTVYPTNPVPEPHIDLILDTLPEPAQFTCLAPFGPGFLPVAAKIGSMRYLLQLNNKGQATWCITEDSGE